MALSLASGATSQTADPGQPRESRASILLVDDRVDNLLALESLLEPMGYELHRAISGEDALRQVLKHDFAVILLDVQMPGMDGFEIAEIIRTRPRYRATPIIFVTAINKDEEYVFRGYDVGAVDYLFKPLRPEILRGKVRAFVDLFEKTEQVRRQEQMLRDAEVREQTLRHRAEILTAQARTREIIESAREAIITFDEDRHVDVFNSTASRMFGLPAPRARGMTVDSFFTPASAAQLDRMIVDSVNGTDGPADASSSRSAVRLTALVAGGATVPLEATVSCLELRGETVFTLIARDVSERDRMERALREQAHDLKASRDELETANIELQRRQGDLEKALHERARFYASMSHELRTPINAIMGYQDLMMCGVYGTLDARLKDPLHRISRSTQHLLDLINDVLDLSKIEAGKFDLQPAPVQVPEIVKDLFATVRPLADGSGSELRLEIGAHDTTITSDPRRVRQILLNLLSNAVKFGEGKPIVVRCDADESSTICVSVIDEGNGIPTDKLDSIFDEFVQLEGARGRGTGLGLAISRRLAHSLGGRLEVESELGAGSVFRLFLGSLVPAEPVPVGATVDA